MTDAPRTDRIGHLVIWIDHEIAHLYVLNRNGVEHIAAIHAEVSGHAAQNEQFFARVAETAMPAREILIVGPSDTRFALRRFLERNAPALATRIVGVELMQRSSERQIHAFCCNTFHHHDVMTPSPPSHKNAWPARADKDTRTARGHDVA